MSRHVLIVDDSRTEQHFLSELMRKKGFTVAVAENGDQAMSALEAGPRPDIILMDVVMPGENGFQLTRKITKHADYSVIPVIICTSKNQATDKVWAMRQGAKDFVTKPVNPAELLEKVDAVLKAASAN